MVVADLHVHTTNSDGQLSFSAVPSAAKQAEVEAVAITDHDRLVSALDQPITEIDGVTVINGIELRVQAASERIDLLGYGVKRTERLAAEIDRLQEDRQRRARTILQRIEAYTGVSLDFDPDSEQGVGRPHIARAIAQSSLEYEYRDAFTELIGEGCPCFVPRQVPSYERGVSLLREACGIVSLAHPLRYEEPEAALSRTTELDAVEYHYDYGRAVDLSLVEQAVRAGDLIVTGGSDVHGTTIGHVGLNREEYRVFYDRLNS